MLEATSAYGLNLLIPTNDTGVGQALREFGEFARPEVELIRELVGNGTYIDIGANLGAIALPVAQSAKRVIAVEANREFANLLAANAINNELHNVAVHHAAVGEKLRLARFPMMPISERGNLGVSGFTLAGKYPEEIVQMTTLDSLAPTDTTVIKVDVEGYEHPVMVGASIVLRDLRPVWIVESATDSPNNRAVMDLLRAAGYSLWWFLTPFVTPTSERSAADAMRRRADFNILAMPDGRRPPWPMLPVNGPAPRPVGVTNYPYLARFGYVGENFADPSRPLGPI